MTNKFNVKNEIIFHCVNMCDKITTDKYQSSVFDEDKFEEDSLDLDDMLFDIEWICKLKG